MTEASATTRKASRKVATEPAAPSPAAETRPVARLNASGRAEVIGRDGSVLSRKRTGAQDIFHIPPHLVPDGWDYQWNPYTVMGETQVSSQIAMAENGWRPVPADRHAGHFMPEGYKGNIIRDGLILEERPMSLTEEAKREEKARADQLVRDNRSQFGLGNKVGPGFSEDRQYRGAGPQVNTRIGPAPEISRPQLEIAPD